MGEVVTGRDAHGATPGTARYRLLGAEDAGGVAYLDVTGKTVGRRTREEPTRHLSQKPHPLSDDDGARLPSAIKGLSDEEVGVALAGLWDVYYWLRRARNDHRPGLAGF